MPSHSPDRVVVEVTSVADSCSIWRPMSEWGQLMQALGVRRLSVVAGWRVLAVGAVVVFALAVLGVSMASAAGPPAIVGSAVTLRACTSPATTDWDSGHRNGYVANDKVGGVCRTGLARLPAPGGNLKPWCWVKDAWWKGATTDKWFYVSQGQAEGYLLGSQISNEGAGLPPCSTIPWIQAASWAIKHVGDTRITPGPEQNGNRETYWNGMCWLFAYDAWTLGAKRGSEPSGWTAALAMKTYGDRGWLDRSGRIPPRGSIVFWGSGPISSSGHAAISLGNGWIMTTTGPGPGDKPGGTGVVLKRIDSYPGNARPTGFVDRTHL